MDYATFIFPHLSDKTPLVANGRLIGMLNMGIDNATWQRIKQLSPEDTLVYETILSSGNLPADILPPELIISSLNSLQSRGFLVVIVDNNYQIVKGAFVKLPVQLFYYLSISDYYEVDPEHLLHSDN